MMDVLRGNSVNMDVNFMFTLYINKSTGLQYSNKYTGYVTVADQYSALAGLY